MENLIGSKFRSGLLTNAEFHAGRNFFGIVYRDYLSFNENSVVLSKEVVSPFRPMDASDIDWFNEYHVEGTYSVNDHFIECYFEPLSWRFTGILEELPNKILIFSNFDERLKKGWSVVYEESI